MSDAKNVWSITIDVSGIDASALRKALDVSQKKLLADRTAHGEDLPNAVEKLLDRGLISLAPAVDSLGRIHEWSFVPGPAGWQIADYGVVMDRRRAQVAELAAIFKATNEAVIADYQASPYSWEDYRALILARGRFPLFAAPEP